MTRLRVALVVAALALLCHPATALYSKKDSVVQLDPSNWDDEIGASNEYWIVEFYAPWCVALTSKGQWIDHARGFLRRTGKSCSGDQPIEVTLGLGVGARRAHGEERQHQKTLGAKHQTKGVRACWSAHDDCACAAAWTLYHEMTPLRPVCDFPGGPGAGGSNTRGVLDEPESTDS